MTPRAVDPATIAAKLGLIEDLLDALDVIGPVDGDRLRAEVVTRLAVERVLTQVVEQVADVCAHVVSSTSRRSATTYRAAVTDAADVGLIDASLAGSLAAASGLRNLLVHHYGRIDHDRVAAAVPLMARDARRFVDQVSRWLLDRG